MMVNFFILTFIFCGFVAMASVKQTAKLFIKSFYVTQAAFAVWICLYHVGQTSVMFFTFDKLGLLFFVLLSIISPLVYHHSVSYLDRESVREFKIYNILLIMLCAAIAGVYFANHLAVTWIFLEATTICTAGLIYHRADKRSLEATWKYIFVCSTGIAIAYLGILLMSSVATNGELSYDNLKGLVVDGNPLYLKIAFLFIVVGYSCKMELFPLYTSGVDANSAAPTPVSALISTGLVNAGFIAIFRVYEVMYHSIIYSWAGNVLIAAGLLSLLIGALYLRRTNNYKRFLAYSTVENMGIVAIGLGVGGVGVFAALLHIVAHTLIKSGLFLQIAQVGKAYGSYRINRIGDYIRYSRTGALALIMGCIAILAFPPSPLFLSEVMIFKQIITNGQWWLLASMLLLICVVIYSFADHILQLCYRPSTRVATAERVPMLPWTIIILLCIVFTMGVWQNTIFIDFLSSIVDFGG